jgi:lysophospholipase L1-like esterase
MKHPIFFALSLLALTIASPLPAEDTTPVHDSSKWDKEIAALTAGDAANPPPKGALLFTGSSTIRLWKTLAQDLPGYQVINRGFGGSEIADATHFADKIIFPYEPRMILIRSGGNDLHNGKTPEQVFGDFLAFVATVHTRLPKATVVYIAASPSIARASEADATRKLNELIQAWTAGIDGTAYLDASAISLGPDGKLRPELFAEDKLHFNAEGYKLLAEKVREFLKTQKAD